MKNKIFEKPTFDFSDLVLLYDCNYHNRNIAAHDLDEGAALYKYAESTKGNILEIGRRWGGVLLPAAIKTNGGLRKLCQMVKH